MQVAVIEFARNAMGRPAAHSIEFDEACTDPAIIFMPEGSRTHMGGTMRLGLRQTVLQETDCHAARLYRPTTDVIWERHRHRCACHGKLSCSRWRDRHCMAGGHLWLRGNEEELCIGSVTQCHNSCISDSMSSNWQTTSQHRLATTTLSVRRLSTAPPDACCLEARHIFKHRPASLKPQQEPEQTRLCAQVRGQPGAGGGA